MGDRYLIRLYSPAKLVSKGSNSGISGDRHVCCSHLPEIKNELSLPRTTPVLNRGEFASTAKCRKNRFVD